MPAVVRPLDDVPGAPLVTSPSTVEMTETVPSTEQLAAIEEPGVVFVSAGAGTGKTTVLVERFVKAVCERELSIDSVLVITYTERAAGELRSRIRERLAALNRPDLARDLDRAWISTIHGFCHRLLRSHPFEAGLDPRFRVLDESQSRVLRAEAFVAALTRFLASRDPERFAGYNEMLAAVEGAALEELATRDRALLEGLLQEVDAAYREAKAAESALDFEDLQLIARDLLQGNERVREATRWRFRSLLVDEFQDTNLLQCELIDLVGSDEVFFVGDEFQSIYRFRHADVEVFRQRREASAGVLALTENYRSRPEVLAVVNQLFGAEFGGDFEPLVAAGRFEEPLFGPAVEVLVTDKSSYREGDVHWRGGGSPPPPPPARGPPGWGEGP